MFALADATLIRPLPYPQPDRLVMVWERTRGSRSGVSPTRPSRLGKADSHLRGPGGDPFGARRQVRLLEATRRSLQSADRQSVTARFFDVLGVKPSRGPNVHGRRCASKAPPPVLVMSEGFWRTRFSGDPSLVGRQIRLNGEPVHGRRASSADDVQLQRPARSGRS